MRPTIVLDGRKFNDVLQNVSSIQFDYIQAHIRLAGGVEIVGDLDGVKRTRAERAEELFTRILLRGQKTSILAGFLVEDGKVWSPAEADRNAARFDAITDHDEIRAMATLIVDFGFHYFELGEMSPESSQKSSSPEIPPTKNAARPN
jgi:hypothetical protein